MITNDESDESDEEQWEISGFFLSYVIKFIAAVERDESVRVGNLQQLAQY